MVEGTPKNDHLSNFSEQEKKALAANYYEWSGIAINSFCPYFNELTDGESDELLLTWHKYGEHSNQLNNLILRLDQKYTKKPSQPNISEGMQSMLDHN
jgi:hypothetical protein